MISNPKKFSDELETWLKSRGPKTLNSLGYAFAERSFAVIILLLMIIPATPLPTGGITHAFEIIAMLLALELIAGLKTIWLPASWKNRPAGKLLRGKAIPSLVNKIRWFEKYSRIRMVKLISNPITLRLSGAVLLIFALSAFMAPPFSGLDTLPAMGAVLVCLALILGDGALLIVGYFVGISGIGLIIGLSASVIKLLHF